MHNCILSIIKYTHNILYYNWNIGTIWVNTAYTNYKSHTCIKNIRKTNTKMQKNKKAVL